MPKSRYPASFFSHAFMGQVGYYMQMLGIKAGLRKNYNQGTNVSYFTDYLEAVNDCCEYLGINLTQFVSYINAHQSLIEDAWKRHLEDPSTFYSADHGEAGRANICMNCVASFSVTYNYNVLSLLLVELGNKATVCDFGCTNADISMAMLLRDKISRLTMSDFNNSSAEFIKYRIGKYKLQERAAWKNLDEIYDEEQYDVILCMDVLEHCVDPSHILEHKIFPMLKRGGYLLMQAPWGGDNIGHLEEAVVDFYRYGGRRFLSSRFNKIYAMTTLDISGIWIKK